MSNISELYQQVILEHNKKPKNYGMVECFSHSSEGLNPLCGDHIKVYLKISETGHIENLSFKGSGCAISKASASMMTVALKGKSQEQCRILTEQFIELVKGNKDVDLASLGKLKIFQGVWRYPSRVKCAVLSWHAFLGALTSKESVTTE